MPAYAASRLYTDAMTTKAASPHAEGIAPRRPCAPSRRRSTQPSPVATARGALRARRRARRCPTCRWPTTVGSFGLLAAIGAAVVAAAASGDRILALTQPPGPGVAAIAPVLEVHGQHHLGGDRPHRARLPRDLRGLPCARTRLHRAPGHHLLGDRPDGGDPRADGVPRLSLRVADDDAAHVVAADGVHRDRHAHLDGDDARPDWWKVHFSQLGTFDDLSSFVFNGTLIAGGLLVTTFAVYIANDMHALVSRGKLTNPRASRIVSTLFVIMGIMLACVGIFPVDVSLLLHNLSATGMAVMFLVLLIAGPKLLRGMPRTYFLSAWAFLGGDGRVGRAVRRRLLLADRVRDHRVRADLRLDRRVHPLPRGDRPARVKCR